jgi:hypothetical protein
MSLSFWPVAEWRSTNMAEWIEVPAHRIYVISERELRDAFDYIGENGRRAPRDEIPLPFRTKEGRQSF